MGKRGEAKEREGLEWERVGWQRKRVGLGEETVACNRRVGIGWERVVWQSRE